MVYKHVFVEIANRFLSSVALSFMVAPALRLFGASIGKRARMYSPLILHNTKFGNLSVGEGCHIGRGVLLDLQDRIHIGDDVTISMNVTIVTHLDTGSSLHGTADYLTERAPVRIGAGVYVGAGATILHGINVGENSLVAAGSLVREDVPAGSVVAGVPARLVKRIPNG